MKLAATCPIRLVCRLLGVPRSSVYYAARSAPYDEAMLKTALLDVAGEWPTYGYRRLTAMMRRLASSTAAVNSASPDSLAWNDRKLETSCKLFCTR